MITTDRGRLTAQPQPSPQRVGVDLAHRAPGSPAPAVQRRQRLPEPALIERQLLEQPRSPGPRRQPIPGQVGDVGVELPQPVPRGVVAHQPGPDHGAVGVDDPSPGRPHRAVVRLGVGDLFAAIEDAGSTADTRLRQTRPTTGTLPAPNRDRTSPRSRRRSRVASRRRNQFREHTLRRDPGRGRCRSRLAQAGLVVRRDGSAAARRRAAPGRRAPPRRGSPDAARRRGRGRRRPPGCAVPSPAAPGRCRCPPLATPEPRSAASSVPIEQVASCTTTLPPGQPPGPVQRHRRRGGLLQRLVGEQPARPGSGPSSPSFSTRGAAAASSPPAPAPDRRIGLAAAAISATRVASVSSSSATAVSAAAPDSDRR